MKNEFKKEKNKQKDRTRVEFSMKSSSVDDRIDTDPYGSYTGVPDDPYDMPVQDADDL
ncbi:MAG: hypothetical protein IKC34_01105 [Clostridia bacterium]|nr:hypothetical protein [Clostridia bacterium]